MSGYGRGSLCFETYCAAMEVMCRTVWRIGEEVVGWGEEDWRLKTSRAS